MPDKRWIILTAEGSVFAEQDEHSLAMGTARQAAAFRVFCSDLTERRILTLKNRAFKSRNPFNLLYGAAYWVADPVLSDPIRNYEMPELRDLAFRANSELLERYGANTLEYRACLDSAQTFEDVFGLILRPDDCPGVVIDPEATKI